MYDKIIPVIIHDILPYMLYIQSSGCLVATPSTNKVVGYGSEPRRITLCRNLFHYHSSQNAEGKHRQETDIGHVLKSKIRRHL